MSNLVSAKPETYCCYCATLLLIKLSDFHALIYVINIDTFNTVFLKAAPALKKAHFAFVNTFL